MEGDLFGPSPAICTVWRTAASTSQGSGMRVSMLLAGTFPAGTEGGSTLSGLLRQYHSPFTFPTTYFHMSSCGFSYSLWDYTFQFFGSLFCGLGAGMHPGLGSILMRCGGVDGY